MESQNEIRKQAGKIGFLLTAVFISLNAWAQQEPTTSTAAAPETAARQIVVSIPDRKLALIENGEVKKIFPVAVGKESTPSPAGSFHIVSRVANPTYYHEGQIVPPGSANPVGTRWMGLSEHGYGIHGTNAPNSIGKAASHGCIRMARADLEQLFALVQVGDEVEIRAERDEQTAGLFGSSEKTNSTEKANAPEKTEIAAANLGVMSAAE